MNPKNSKKSPIHENADANITCDFGDGDISRSRSFLSNTCTTGANGRRHDDGRQSRGLLKFNSRWLVHGWRVFRPPNSCEGLLVRDVIQLYSIRAKGRYYKKQKSWKVVVSTCSSRLVFGISDRTPAAYFKHRQNLLQYHRGTCKIELWCQLLGVSPTARLDILVK